MRGAYKLPDGNIMMDDGSTLSVDEYNEGGHRPKVEKLKSESTATKKLAAKAKAAAATEESSEPT